MSQTISNNIMIQKDIKQLKIVLIGESAVGKTRLLQKFQNLDTEFSPRATIGHGNNVVVELQIWDTAGQERYKALGNHYFRNAHGAILVYDVTRSETLGKLDSWLKQLDEYDTINVRIIVGNKIDCAPDRTVSFKDGNSFASAHGTMYTETSALTNAGVRDAFLKVAQKIMETSNVQNNKGLQLEASRPSKRSWCWFWFW
ncbi:ras-related protein Rab-18-B-like isoform X2 [Malaya genurostris]|uniref:ras-related protein Rab-18-B-like isoform X2 n=1 Tax=Malaya genurostris TaxID=325434 RepID=UPI0026F407C1|nr:ras-related protein Rab-18-B-like isoform X2 [Malaya genurostris]